MNAIVERFNPLFKPKTVAVVGASTKGAALPNVFIRRIRELGFTGAIYPIHPTAPEIDGFKAYRSLAETPEPIDYTFIASAGAQIPPLLAAANGRVRFAQVISSGFGEVDEGRDLQQKLVDAARAGGMGNLVEAVMQLRVAAGDRQIANPNVAMVHGMGGVFATHGVLLLGRSS